MTNILNPKAILFYMTVLPLFLTPNSNHATLDTLLLAAIYVSIATLMHLVIVLSADQLRPYLVTGPRELFVRRLLAGSLAIVALWFFAGSRR